MEFSFLAIYDAIESIIILSGKTDNYKHSYVYQFTETNSLVDSVYKLQHHLLLIRSEIKLQSSAPLKKQTVFNSCEHFTEVKRRKWLEMNPESSNNDYPVVFDTSIIPWWAWMKRFHLPEAELLNGLFIIISSFKTKKTTKLTKFDLIFDHFCVGRAAMIGFFMAYFVDSFTGVGLVDQTGNFFCKTLLFVAVSGVLLIRKNEDLDNLKKLVEETTYYDKQWQATWKEEKKE